MNWSIGKMGWLLETDRAAVELARTYALRIDQAAGTEDAVKALYLGPHLLKALQALGGTPAERKALGVEGAVGGKLAQLRSAHRAAS